MPDIACRIEPVSRTFGFDRGKCIDRVFIERFLDRHRGSIRGRVLEVAERTYTDRFGTDAEHVDMLHIDPTNRSATVVRDLTRTQDWPAESYDCILLTQTLQHVFDVSAAVRTIHHTLAPGGCALITVPGVSQISRYDMDRWGDYWRFTTLSIRRLFEQPFAPQDVDVESFGNILTCVGLLHGLAAHELPADAFEHNDRDYQMLITVRATKPGAQCNNHQ